MAEQLKTPLQDAFDGTDFLNLAEAARLMRGKVRGQPPHVQTVRRWANPSRGYRADKGGTGPVVVLQTIRLHGDIFTTREWALAFEEARLRLGAREAGRDRAPTERQAAAAHKRAEKSLDRRGCR